MIPENQQEALRKLTSKEAILSAISVGESEGIDAISAVIDTDGYTYVHIFGNASLNEGDGTEMFEIINIPAGMMSCGSYVASNDNGGGGSVFVTRVGTTARIKFTAGAVGRTVYFSVLLSKRYVDI